MRRVPFNRPVEAKRILNALSAESRVRMLASMVENRRGMTATELSERMNMALSTTVQHLDILTSTGLVKWTLIKGKRGFVKLYRAPSRRISLNIDISLLSKVPPMNVLDKRLREFMDRIREEKKLPPNPSVEDVRRFLDVKEDEAVIYLDFFNQAEDKILDKLSEEFKKLEKREYTVKELSDVLRVDEYWVVRLTRRLEEEGVAIVERDRIVLLQSDPRN